MSANDNFVGTRPVSEAHQFDVNALQTWLEQNMPGFAGPLSVEMFKGGQSNPTFKLITPSASYVMRAKPGPVAKLLPSAHAVEREFAVMRGLYGTSVPVAKMHVLCEDESVIGRAFYVMEFVQGRVLWDQSLPDMTKAQRRDIYNEMNRVIAALHTVPYAERGLENFGKPGNYFERQIGRWSKQYIASITQPIPEMDKLMAWLPANMPASARDGRTSIVHGDYRLDNMMFHPSEPRVLAVLDWELSTLGDPLVDFAYHCMVWRMPASSRGLSGVDVAGLGIPDEAHYLNTYLKRTGRTTEVPAQEWNYYLVFNMFRLVGILQGIAKRAQQGNASNATAVETGKRARPLAEQAWALAQTIHPLR